MIFGILSLTAESLEVVMEDPEKLFTYLSGTLITTGVTAKAWPYLKSYTVNIGAKKTKSAPPPQDSKSGNGGKNSKGDATTKPAVIVSLQNRFLPVFYLLRTSFWMAGPYFYQVYSSKTLSHADGSTSMATNEFVANVSLVGFLSVVLLGPLAGRIIDGYGRKTATVFTGMMYAAGSMSVFSSSVPVLYAGRAVASIASSRLTSTPEAWLIGECMSATTEGGGEGRTLDSRNLRVGVRGGCVDGHPRRTDRKLGGIARGTSHRTVYDDSPDYWNRLPAYDAFVE